MSGRYVESTNSLPSPSSHPHKFCYVVYVVPKPSQLLFVEVRVSRRRPTIKFVGFVARSYLVVYEFTGVDEEQFTETGRQG